MMTNRRMFSGLGTLTMLFAACGESDGVAREQQAETNEDDPIEETAGVEVAKVDCNAPDDCPGSQPVTGEVVSGTGESGATEAPPKSTVEIPCNGVDEDDDGLDFCLGDADGDGVPADFDCDDLNPEVHPKQVETRCDGKDQNCDGLDDCDSDQDGVLDRTDCAPLDPTSTTECFGGPTEPPPVN